MNHQEILKKYWGYISFRQGQEEVITKIIEGKDVVAILPTGGGKSIIYQVAGLSKNGITLVISPLIALIQDQVNKLNSLGIKSIALTGSLKPSELQRLLDNAQFSDAKFLFISPERLQNSFVQRRLKQMDISLVAVDEAHCISEWGHDFRPSYLKISILKDAFPQTPFLALTATANKRVENDIKKYLKLDLPFVLRQSVKRDNLAYKVINTNDKLGELLERLSKKDTQIIYVRTRKQTIKLADDLRNKGFSVAYFHGGVAYKTKQNILNDWLQNKIKIIVSTNAFGMGIDKANVRKVIHYDLPNSIENYIQEAGRAGRDQKYAEALILCTDTDISYYQSVYIDQLPNENDVIKVYKSLYNSFFIAEGEGEDLEFDFDYENFCKRFNLNIFRTFDILKILESEEIIELNHNRRFFPEVHIKITPLQIREYLNRKQKYHELLQLLLRIYSDIFYVPVKINPTKIIDILGYKINDFEKALNFFQQKEIIDYKPQGKDLTVRFLVNKDRFLLQRKTKNFKKRIEIKKHQLQSFLSYVTNDKTCRAKQLSKYFDEDIQQDCGLCDVCLTHTNPLTIEEVKLKITALLEQKCRKKSFLQEQFNQDISEILNHLIEQNKIYYDAINGYCKRK